MISGGKSTCELPLTGPVFCWGEPSYGATTATSSAFSTLGGGGFQYCGIKTVQQLECWGHNGDNRATPPGGLFRQISVSAEDACALRADGTAACWGFTADGRASVPPGSYTRISLGWYHGCAIRPDATLVCWGRPQSGEEIHPPANERFREIAANASATCGIRSGYTLVCFGGSPTPPSGYFIALGPSVGGHMCAIAFDRSLACWGQNDFGQADPPAGQFIQVSEGLWHSCAVKTDHSVVCWGSNATGATTVGQPPPPAPAFTLIVVQPNPAGVGPGQAVQLTAAAFDVAHNPVAAFAPTWTSADTHVATVDGHGIVTGVANGTAVVTASSNGVSGSSTVSVGQPIINPFPQAPQQFILQVLPGVPGTGISAIGNAGTGILTGLQVLNVPGNCGTNPAGSWLSFAFDGTTAPTNLRVTATVPTGTPYGVYDCVFTLAGSGAPNRPHGIRVSVQEVVVSNPPWIDPFPQAGSQNVIDVSAGGTTVKNVPVGNPGGGTLSGLTFVEPIRNCATGAPVTWLTYAWQSTTAPTTLILTASPPMTTTPGQYDLCFELRARAVGAMDRSYGARVNVGPVVGPTGPWDAAADFSETNNPTGQWSSGWTTTLGSLFAIYDVHERQDGDVLAAWRDSFFNQFGTITPTFQKNISIASVVYGIAPGQVSLHSGCAHGELGVLRWTAPAAGTYTIHATFFAGNSGNTDAYVLLDGNGGQPLLAAPTTNVQPSYAGTLTLLFGQTIDFVVGTGGDGCGSDSTPFVATIQRQ